MLMMHVVHSHYSTDFDMNMWIISWCRYTLLYLNTQFNVTCNVNVAQDIKVCLCGFYYTKLPTFVTETTTVTLFDASE